MTSTSIGTIGWQWLDVRLHRRACRQARAGPAPSRLRRLATTAVAVVVHLGAVAALVTGTWLCTLRFPGVAILPGAILIVFGALTLPRPAALPRGTVVSRRADAPALHELTDRVAATLGVPRPSHIVLDERFAADSGFAGLLRQRYLRIGIPLWAVLDPGQRIALVALELARFGVGDPSRAALTGTVESSLATLVAIFDPAADKAVRDKREASLNQDSAGSPWHQVRGEQATLDLSESLLRPFIAVLQGLIGLVRLGYLTLLQPESFAAVYASDASAAGVAGAPAVRGVFAVRLLAESMVTVLRRDARAGDHGGVVHRDSAESVVAGWPAIAADLVAQNAPSLLERCAADVQRAASPFAVTPPLGRRAEVLADAPVDLLADLGESAESDQELRLMYRRMVRDLRNG